MQEEVLAEREEYDRQVGRASASCGAAADMRPFGRAVRVTATHNHVCTGARAVVSVPVRRHTSTCCACALQSWFSRWRGVCASLALAGREADVARPRPALQARGRAQRRRHAACSGCSRRGHPPARHGCPHAGAHGGGRPPPQQPSGHNRPEGRGPVTADQRRGGAAECRGRRAEQRTGACEAARSGCGRGDGAAWGCRGGGQQRSGWVGAAVFSWRHDGALARRRAPDDAGSAARQAGGQPGRPSRRRRSLRTGTDCGGSPALGCDAAGNSGTATAPVGCDAASGVGCIGRRQGAGAGWSRAGAAAGSGHLRRPPGRTDSRAPGERRAGRRRA